MHKNTNPQTVSKHSKGTAQDTTKMQRGMNDALATKQPMRTKSKVEVHTVTIDLTKSTNRLADFKRRVLTSQNIIDGYPNAALFIKWGKKRNANGFFTMASLNTVEKFQLADVNGTTIALREGDKRVRWNWFDYAKWDKKDLTRSQFLLDNAESIIENMQFFSEKYCSNSAIIHRFKFRPNLGLTKQQYVESFLANHPQWDSFDHFDLMYGRGNKTSRKELQLDGVVYATGRSFGEQRAEYEAKYHLKRMN